MKNHHGIIMLALALAGMARLCAQPVITANPTNQAALVGSRVFLTAGVSGTGPLTFQWQMNGTNVPNNLIATIVGNGTAGDSPNGSLAVTGMVNTAFAVMADSFDNVYVADTYNQRIFMISTNGVMTDFAGRPGSSPNYSGDGGVATSALLAYPEGMTLDTGGNLYFADKFNHRIRKVDTNGIITTVAGMSGYGYNSDGIPATNATLYYPVDVAADTNGNLYVADTSNNRIRKIDSGGYIHTVAGNGNPAFSGDGGSATNAEIDAPQGVAVDTEGNIYIADTHNYRVRKVDTFGTITTIAGTGSNSFSGDGGAATNAGVYPLAVTVDNYGDVLIADNNNRIRQVAPSGIITTIAGTVSTVYNGDGIPATNATLLEPYGVAFDSYGRVLVADTDHQRIRRFGQGPTFVIDNVAATNAGNYTLIVNSSSGSVTSSVAALTVLLPPTITMPLANQSAGLGGNATFTVAVTGTAPLAYQWLMNGTNLPNQTNPTLNLTNVQWTDAGSYSVIITNSYGSVTSTVATLTVGIPPAFVIQPGDQMVLARTNLVLGVSISGGGPFRYQWQFNGTNLPAIMTTVAGTNGAGLTGDNGPAVDARLNVPEGVAVDAVGNVFIADYSNNRVRRVDTNGIITTVVGTGTQGNGGNGGLATAATLYRPTGLVFDSSGNLYIAEYGNADVRKVDTNGYITRVAGTGGVGISGDGGQATSTSFDTLSGIALDNIGNMYLSENMHCRIRKVGANGIVTTLAGNTTGVTGGFSGDGGVATNAQLNAPGGVALDLAGNVFIADSSNYRVRKVDSSGIITTVVGIGGASYNGDNRTATTATVSPSSVIFDSAGNLIISDAFERIRRVDTNGIITTIAGKGSGGFTGDGGVATNATLFGPAQAAFDQAGNLFIADANNNRIRKVHLAGDPTLTLSNIGITNTGTYSMVVSSPFGSVTSTNFTVTVLAVPLIGSLAPNLDGSITLNFSTTPNISSRVYATTSLSPPVVWLPLYTNLSGGAWQFTDTNAIGQPELFYRVSTP